MRLRDNINEKDKLESKLLYLFILYFNSNNYTRITKRTYLFLKYFKVKI